MLDLTQIPNFIIAGAQKSGTTSLHYYLNQHPELFLPGGKFTEVHFFEDPINYSRGKQWYLKCFESRKDERIIGETTPAYLYFPFVAKRIFNHNPAMKLIFILRNPIERAYSHYWHEVRLGREELSFESALEIEQRRINKDFLSNKNFSYTKRGMYYEQITNFLNFFPIEHILILIFENFIRNTEEELRKCLTFLGVDSSFSIDFTNKRNQAQVAKLPIIDKVFKKLKWSSISEFNEKYNLVKGYNPMSVKTRKILFDHFYESNQKLEVLLEIKTGWNS